LSEAEERLADRRIFMTSILYFMYLKGQGSLKAGEYEFSKYASMRQVLDTLGEGKSIEHKVTLAEGLTSQQIVEKIRANPDLHGEIAEIPAEGTLLPDTYKFGRNDTRADIVERMQAAQAKFLAKVWEDRDPDIVVTTPEEAVILASIVEKETGRADERPHIASVFQNRLRKNIRLQSDPTDKSDLNRLAASVADTGGVVFVPALSGLGSPWWDPYARGTVLGITRGTTRAHLARAVVEAMAWQTRDVVDAMTEAAGRPVAELRVDGGASVMDLLCQLQADILGVPVRRAAVQETTALGAAFLAGLGVGVWSDPSEVGARWSADAAFEPAMAPAAVEAGHRQWLRAVDRSRGWARER